MKVCRIFFFFCEKYSKIPIFKCIIFFDPPIGGSGFAGPLVNTFFPYHAAMSHMWWRKIYLGGNSTTHVLSSWQTFCRHPIHVSAHDSRIPRTLFPRICRAPPGGSEGPSQSPRSGSESSYILGKISFVSFRTYLRFFKMFFVTFPAWWSPSSGDPPWSRRRSPRKWLWRPAKHSFSHNFFRIWKIP